MFFPSGRMAVGPFAARSINKNAAAGRCLAAGLTQGWFMQTVSERQLNIDLLLIRLGVAATLLVYALPRLLGGNRMWMEAGRDLRLLQADFPSQIVGLVVLIIQVLGCVGLITGGLFRISTALLTVIYGLHCLDFVSSGYKTLPLYAAASACVCIGLMIAGPGRFAVAIKIEKK
jgi:uncharacterized membrane protein YphA (DoxX/SURF4 family)